MKLKIKKMNGDTFSLEVGDADSVMALKAQIKERECVDEARQRLIYHGRVLKDEDLLSSYSIAEEGTIHLVLRPEGVPPQAAANAASPAPLDQSAQAVLPLQNIGNGVLMGSVTLDANAMHNSDLTAIMSQLFSTLGNAATAQPAAEPPQAAQSALGAPQALTHRVRRIAPFRATLEESVVQADVVTSVSRGFALGGSAPPSRPYTSSAHDLDSANDSLAVAEALVSLSEALEAVQTPIGCVIGNFRAGGYS